MENYTIYFTLDTDSNTIKIGRTQNIDNRIVSLQTSNSSELKYIALLTGVTKEFEQHIHVMCRKYHVRGEWFKRGALDFILEHPWYKDHIEILNRRKRK